jgi:hypothetical protein
MCRGSILNDNSITKAKWLLRPDPRTRDCTVKPEKAVTNIDVLEPENCSNLDPEALRWYAGIGLGGNICIINTPEVAVAVNKALACREGRVAGKNHALLDRQPRKRRGFILDPESPWEPGLPKARTCSSTGAHGLIGF